MKGNTYIRIKNENPKRVKENLIDVSNMISTNNYNSFPFIEITEIVSYTSGIRFEEKTEYAEEKRYININFILSFEAII
jgi:CO dehydrogenase/acetyl-CoA synthase beta subunit